MIGQRGPWKSGQSKADKEASNILSLLLLANSCLTCIRSGGTRGVRYIDEKLSKADKSVFLKLSANYRYRKMKILKLSKNYRYRKMHQFGQINT